MYTDLTSTLGGREAVSNTASAQCKNTPGKDIIEVQYIIE